MVTPQHVLIEGNFRLTDQTTAIATRGLTVQVAPAGIERTPALYLGFRRPAPRWRSPISQSRSTSASTKYSITRSPTTTTRLRQNRRKSSGSIRPPFGWLWLGVQDETASFTRRGLVTFIGPPDLGLSTAFGQEACWLRARWADGAYVAPPSLHRLVTNTMWARHASRFVNEVIGSGTSEPEQTINTSERPVLDGERLEVAGDRAAA